MPDEIVVRDCIDEMSSMLLRRSRVDPSRAIIEFTNADGVKGDLQVDPNNAKEVIDFLTELISQRAQ